MVEQGSWHSPRQPQPWDPAAEGAPTYGASAPAPARGRPVLAALIAVLTEVIVVAVVFNQAVARHIENVATQHDATFAGRAARGLLVYRWRVSPPRGDNRSGFHEWDHELLTLGVLLVLTALLVAVFVRGAMTFWKVFFGTWFTVVVATCVAAAVGSLVTRSAAPAGWSKGTAAVFSVVNGGTVFAGLVLGLVVALLTALVATVTRRRPVAATAAAPAADSGYLAPEAPPPYYGEAAGGTGSAPSRGEPQWRSRPDPRGEAATTALPTGVDEEDQRTRSTVRLPRPESDDQPTSAYQVPPDDTRR